MSDQLSGKLRDAIFKSIPKDVDLGEVRLEVRVLDSKIGRVTLEFVLTVPGDDVPIKHVYTQHHCNPGQKITLIGFDQMFKITLS